MGAGIAPRARQIHLEYAGAACHVMVGGSQARDGYGDERDRMPWQVGLEKQASI